jgi:hypothetical protein
MKAKKKNYNNIKLYILVLLPFLISLLFYYYSINNKKFYANYQMTISQEIINKDILQSYLINMMPNNPGYSTLDFIKSDDLIVSFKRILNLEKYNTNIRDVNYLREKKNLIVKEIRHIDKRGVNAQIRFGIYGKNYDKILIDRYLSDLMEISLDELKNTILYKKELLQSVGIEKRSLLYELIPSEIPNNININFNLVNIIVENIDEIIEVFDREDNKLISLQESLNINSDMSYFKVSVILYIISFIVIIFILKIYSLSKNKLKFIL